MLAPSGKHVRVCHGLCPCLFEAKGPSTVFAGDTEVCRAAPRITQVGETYAAVP